jgi:hypothetical protein
MAAHAVRADCDLALWMQQAFQVAQEGSLWGTVPLLPESEPLILLHGDGPPGKVPGAIGADKLSELACMEGWPARRRLKRFPVEQRAGESWGQAAARRNAAMVAARPRRAYAIHTDLDASKGSSMTASFLTSAGIPYWYVRVRQSGELVSVEQR